MMRSRISGTQISGDLNNTDSAMTHFSKTTSEPDVEVTELSNVSHEERSGPVEATDYITLNALGWPSKEQKVVRSWEIMGRRMAQHPGGAFVLIDEIDKAPRDFPNDLLNEIERYMFEIKELSHKEIRLDDEEKEKDTHFHDEQF
jgi:MoxR-like ATPase